MFLHPTRFWNLMARGYSRSPVKDLAAYQYKLEKTASYFDPEDRILEIACGTGTTALIHAPKVAQIDAIDFSSEMIAIAHEKAAKQNTSNINFKTSSFEDWPLPENEIRYDHVLGMSILHLLPKLDTMLTRVYEMMKPGAYFFSSTVCLGELKGIAAIARYALPALATIGLLPKIIPLTSNLLQDKLTSAGFEIEHVWRPGEGAAVFIVARRPE